MSLFTIYKSGPHKTPLSISMSFPPSQKVGLCAQIIQVYRDGKSGYIELTRTDWRILRAVIDAQFQEDAK